MSLLESVYLYDGCIIFMLDSADLYYVWILMIVEKFGLINVCVALS